MDIISADVYSNITNTNYCYQVVGVCFVAVGVRKNGYIYYNSISDSVSGIIK